MSAARDPLAGLLERNGVVVLDGGLATTLAARGADLSGRLWSARLLHEDPGLIREVHTAFLNAGADVLVTASYQATLAGFARLGLDAATGRRLLASSVELARQAREEAGRPGALVAASVGPYGAWQAGASEYRGYAETARGTLREFHRDRLAVLAGAEPDLLAIETLPEIEEARVLVELLDELDTPPAWVTFTARDEAHLSDGSEFAAAAREIAAHPRVAAVGINCTRPELISGLLRRAGRPEVAHLAVYPNLGDRWDADAGRWVPRSRPLVELAVEWRRLGAALIGGCCGTSPEHVAALREALVDG